MYKIIVLAFFSISCIVNAQTNTIYSCEINDIQFNPLVQLKNYQLDNALDELNFYSFNSEINFPTRLSPIDSISNINLLSWRNDYDQVIQN